MKAEADPQKDSDMTKLNPFNEFDRILVINLDKDLDKWQMFYDQAVAYGFVHKLTRVPGEGRTPPSYGCALAHKNCMDLARKNGWKKILVFEDDAKFLYSKEYTFDCLSKALTSAGNDWDLLYLGSSMREVVYPVGQQRKIGDVIRSNAKWYGRFAMAVNSSAFNVYDSLPDNLIFENKDRGDVVLAGRKDLRKVLVWPQLVSVQDTPSANDPFLTSCDDFIEQRYVRYGMVDIRHTLSKEVYEHPSILISKQNINESEEGTSRVSVIVPAYGAESFIEQALDSIAAEQPHEILVGVDSCDKTLTSLLKIVHKYQNIKVFMTTDNRGPYITKNSLVQKSTGDVLVFFDADDIMKKGLIARALKELSKGADVVRYSGYTFLSGEPLIEAIPVDWFAFGTTVMTRKAFIRMGGYRDWKCVADKEFMERGFRFLNIVKISDRLFYYRQHGNNLTKRADTGSRSKLRAGYIKQITKNYEDPHIDPVTVGLTEKYSSSSLTTCICITTYNRPVKLNKLLHLLPHNNPNVNIKVFDDGSSTSYTSVVEAFPQAEFYTVKHGGKQLFWRLFDFMFRTLEISERYDRYLFIQDDMICREGVLQDIEEDWSKLTSKDTLALNPVFNIVKYDTNIWKSNSLVLQRIVKKGTTFFKKGFIDCKFYCSVKLLEKLNWSVYPVAPNRWALDPLLGSGVGQQITERLWEKGNMYICGKSHFEFYENDQSLMNPQERKNNMPICKIGNELGYQRVACLASIPQREDGLNEVIASIVPNVDKLYVVLNNYSSVPSYLQNPKITVYRSQDIGDFTDAAKFYPLVQHKFTHTIYYTCDDDIIYPEYYFQHMGYKALQRKCVMTCHGRKLSKPMRDYYKDTKLVKFFRDHTTPFTEAECTFGGTGVMAFCTDYFTVTDMSIFKETNSADVWIGLDAEKKGVKILCTHTRHSGPFGILEYKDSIFDSNRRDTLNIVNTYNRERLHGK